MKSMTGYGQGWSGTAGTSINIEISAVNRKTQDIRVILPRELASLEPAMRLSVQQHVVRGSVSVYLTYELGTEHRLSQQRVDAALAERMANELREIAEKSGIDAPVTMADVLAVPGVLMDEQTHLPLKEIEKLALQALDEAIGGLEKMRVEEGTALSADILTRLDTMVAATETIRQATKESTKHYAARLYDRIRQLDAEMDEDDERLAKEVIFFAERADITEELVRLGSHFDQMRDLLTNGADDIGRTLDFLCQEMNREINTLAAKTSEISVAKEALKLKTELAKIREQVMNVE